jgi:hypothetical protein
MRQQYRDLTLGSPSTQPHDSDCTCRKLSNTRLPLRVNKDGLVLLEQFRFSPHCRHGSGQCMDQWYQAEVNAVAPRSMTW